MTTPTPLTDQQIDEIQARSTAATPGPWSPYTVHGPTFYANVAGPYLRGVGDLDFGVGEQAEADKEFVKHAREDVNALLAEVRRQRAELALAADATEYRVALPDHGGTTLIAKRRSPTNGTGWAVSTMGPGGGRAWTTEGWQDSISALSVDRLFCWPDPTTAIAEARNALSPQSDVMPHDRAAYDHMRDTNPRPGPCCQTSGPVPHWPMWARCGGGNGPGKPIRPHCTCNSCF